MHDGVSPQPENRKAHDDVGFPLHKHVLPTLPATTVLYGTLIIISLSLSLSLEQWCDTHALCKYIYITHTPIASAYIYTHIV